MVSSPDLELFSNISPSPVKNIKIQKNVSHSQSPRSSSASGSNTVSPSVHIIVEPKLDSIPESNNLKTKPTCEKPATKHEYYKPESAEWTLQQIVVDDMPKAVGILRAWMPSCQSREATEETVENL